MISTTVKRTINIEKCYFEQLEYLVKIGEISSISDGINQAIEQFVKSKKKELYDEEMKKAKFDEEFMKRTMGTQKEFEKSDTEVE